VTPDGPQGNDFRPSINQLAAGLNPSDMALIGEAAERKLLVVSPGSRDARVLDARANTSVTIPLTAAATRILLFRGSSPRDPMPAPRALLVGDASSAAAVSVLELTDITARRGQNVETVPLPRAASAVLPLPERDAVMIGHATNESTGQISLLDLTRRTVSPILAEVSLNDARFDSDRQRLWVAPRGTTRVGWIDLRTFSPGELRLDQPVTGVFPLPGPWGAPARVVALHEGNEGALTLLDGPGHDVDLFSEHTELVLALQLHPRAAPGHEARDAGRRLPRISHQHEISGLRLRPPPRPGHVPVAELRG
jgi:hypothetical protein